MKLYRGTVYTVCGLSSGGGGVEGSRPRRLALRIEISLGNVT